jgi:hypothetical protein
VPGHSVPIFGMNDSKIQFRVFHELFGTVPANTLTGGGT